MKRELKYITQLGLYITALFVAGMLMTFVNDWIQASGFFGDTKFIPHPSAWNKDYIITEDGAIDTEYVWGARHYWYFWLCFILFMLSLVRIAVWSYGYWNTEKQDCNGK